MFHDVADLGVFLISNSHCVFLLIFMLAVLNCRLDQIEYTAFFLGHPVQCNTNSDVFSTISQILQCGFVSAIQIQLNWDYALSGDILGLWIIHSGVKCLLTGLTDNAKFSEVQF